MNPTFIAFMLIGVAVCVDSLWIPHVRGPCCRTTTTTTAAAPTEEETTEEPTEETTEEPTTTQPVTCPTQKPRCCRKCPTCPTTPAEAETEEPTEETEEPTTEEPVTCPTRKPKCCRKCPTCPTAAAPTEEETEESTTEATTTTPAYSCAGKADGVYDNGCSGKFCSCSEGVATCMECPAGLKYDSASARCVEAIYCGACGGSPTTPAPTPVYTTAASSPCEGRPYGVYGQGHCSPSYTICLAHKVAHGHCPSPLRFDPVSHICARPNVISECQHVPRPVFVGQAYGGAH